MRYPHLILHLVFPALVLMSSIAAYSEDPLSQGKQEIQGTIQERSGMSLQPFPEKSNEEVQKTIQTLFQKGLTLDEAMTIAILNNPTFKAVSQELDIARSDLRQAGLPENPEVSAGFLLPVSGETQLLPHVTATQNILDLFLTSLRKKVALSQL